jgi:hypothetical protein
MRRGNKQQQKWCSATVQKRSGLAQVKKEREEKGWRRVNVGTAVSVMNEQREEQLSDPLPFPRVTRD